MQERSEGLAHWKLEPFYDCSDKLDKIIDILAVTMNGCFLSTNYDKILNRLKEYEDDGFINEIKHQTILDDQAKEAGEHEIETSFRYTTSQALVQMWSALEDSIKNYVINHIHHENEVHEIPEIGEIEIKYSDYLQSNDFELSLAIAEEYIANRKFSYNSGVTRFEVLLKPFGISGKVPQNVKYDIYEMQKLRNCIVHRSGKVDQILLEECPKIDAALGENVPINTTELLRYHKAMTGFLRLILEWLMQTEE